MLRIIALISAIYDISVGVTLVFFRDRLQTWLGVAAPGPPIHVDLNAIFVTVVGIGFVLPLLDPDRYRAYLWLFGTLLKGAGAAVFVWDYLARSSPASYLLFAVSDGTLAVVTLLVLLRAGRRRPTRGSSAMPVSRPTDSPSYPHGT
jgi:hypothetical protein